MWHEYGTCPMTHAAIATPRAFATAGGTLQHCANLSVAAFAVLSNVWAAWFCFAAPLLACAVPQSCWTSLRGIAPRRPYHCNHRAHIAGGCQIAVVFDTCVSRSNNIRWVCGQVNVCMICGWLLACCRSWVGWRMHSSSGCLHVVCCLSLNF